MNSNHPVNRSAFERETFAARYAANIRRNVNRARRLRAQERTDHYRFTGLHAQDADYNGADDLVVVARTGEPLVGIGPFAARDWLTALLDILQERAA